MAARCLSVCILDQSRVECEQPFDKTEDDETTGEPPQESLIVDIETSKDQIIKGYQAVDELQLRYISSVSQRWIQIKDV